MAEHRTVAQPFLGVVIAVTAVQHQRRLGVVAAVKGVLTTYLGVDWFRNRSNEHPGITQQHTPDQ